MGLNLKDLDADGLHKRIAEMIAEGEGGLQRMAEAMVKRAQEDITALRGAVGADFFKDAVILQARDFDLAQALPLEVTPYAELHFRDSNQVMSTSTYDNYRRHGVTPLPAGKYRLVVALLPVAVEPKGKK